MRGGRACEGKSAVEITRAVITAAARNQRTLPLQSLVDRDGLQKPVLRIILNEARQAGIEELCVVTCPGDEAAYREAAGELGETLHFVSQEQPLGYGHAVYCAREFVGDRAFLHMVGDHVYVGRGPRGLAHELVEVARTHSCPVSGVEPTRESLLPYFGAIGGQRVKGSHDLYTIERVLEKPTPTQAEQLLLVPGLRAGHYLCFFGMHVLTPVVMEMLEEHVRAAGDAGGVQLSPVLHELAGREQYLALETGGQRYPVDVPYGLLTAQLALALSGRDREEVLENLVELLARTHKR
jgi:UTP--glucose-1-phosphate uridylyltransferase